MPQRVKIGRRPARRTGGGNELVDPYDAGRDLADKPFYSACYAPSASMYFDQMGDVRACCQNTGHLLGNVREQTIRDIWESAQADHLRESLRVRDLSAGCGFCKWQVDEGGSSPFARDFDRHRVESVRPRWPVQMEFSMTNSCNLQCVMCNGDWSSSIRAHRERRPPLPVVYEDRFFDELAEFLPHLDRANFLGGEPFLGKEPLRVMNMLVDSGSTARVTVTTNATQWSDRIEQICDALDMSFVVSLDGITRSTYEAVRIGADFGVVMRNIDRFRQRVDGRTTTVSVAHCLMRPNWHEFAELLLWAESNDIASVGVNSVVFPAELSLYQMTEGELREVVARMELQDVEQAAGLTRLRGVWEAQLEQLRNRLVALQSGGTRVDPWPESGGVAPARAAEPIPPARLERVRTALCEELGIQPIVVRTVDETVTEVDVPDWAGWLSAGTWTGHHIDDLGRVIDRTVGTVSTIAVFEDGDGLQVVEVEVDEPSRRRTISVHLFVESDTDQRGCYVVERPGPLAG